MPLVQLSHPHRCRADVTCQLSPRPWSTSLVHWPRVISWSYTRIFVKEKWIMRPKQSDEQPFTYKNYLPNDVLESLWIILLEALGDVFIKCVPFGSLIEYKIVNCKEWQARLLLLISRELESAKSYLPQWLPNQSWPSFAVILRKLHQSLAVALHRATLGLRICFCTPFSAHLDDLKGRNDRCKSQATTPERAIR